MSHCAAREDVPKGDRQILAAAKDVELIRRGIVGRLSPKFGEKTTLIRATQRKRFFRILDNYA